MALFALLIAGSFSFGARASLYIESGALNTLRFFFAVLVLVAVAVATTPRSQRSDVFRPAAAWRFIILGALLGFYFVTMFIALEITHPVSTGAVFTLMPLLATGFAYFLLRQSARPVVILSLLISGVGAIWVIFRGDIAAILAFDIGYGEFIYFFGTLSHALYAPLVNKFNRGEPMVHFSLWTLTGTFLCIAVYGLPEILATQWAQLPTIVWVTIAYLAIFTTAGTISLLQYALLRIPAAKATVYIYLTPVYIIFIEGLAGSGWVSLSVFAGALVIILGLVILVRAADV